MTVSERSYLVSILKTLNLEERDGHNHSHSISQEHKVARDSVFDVTLPSTAGSRGYPLSKRICLLKMWERDKHSVSKSLWNSLYRWSKRLVPYKMTRNKQSYVMTGHHRFLLALFKKSTLMPSMVSLLSLLPCTHTMAEYLPTLKLVKL